MHTFWNHVSHWNFLKLQKKDGDGKMRCEILKNVSDELKIWGGIEIEYGHKFHQIKSDSHQLEENLRHVRLRVHKKMISEQVERKFIILKIKWNNLHLWDS